MSVFTALDRPLTINPELEHYLPAPADAKTTEGEDLERVILADGIIYDPIIVWKGHNIIVDGHRRYRISVKTGIPFSVCERDFPSIEAVKYWMGAHQLSKRNMVAAARAVVLADMMEFERRGGLGSREAAKKISSETGVSQRTIHGASQFAKALETIPVPFAEKIKSGELKIPMQDVVELSKYNPDDQIEIIAEFEDGTYNTLREAMGGDEGQDSITDEEVSASVPESLEELEKPDSFPGAGPASGPLEFDDFPTSRPTSRPISPAVSPAALPATSPTTATATALTLPRPPVTSDAIERQVVKLLNELGVFARHVDELYSTVGDAGGNYRRTLSMITNIGNTIRAWTGKGSI